ncbi:hypothetical protein ACLOJK_000302 [Asimina triloba]
MVRGDRLVIYHANHLQWGPGGHVRAYLRKMARDLKASSCACHGTTAHVLFVRRHQPPIRRQQPTRSFAANWRSPSALAIEDEEDADIVIYLLLGDSTVDMPSTKKMMMSPMLLPVTESSPLGDVLKIVGRRCRHYDLEGTSVGAGRGDVDR